MKILSFIFLTLFLTSCAELEIRQFNVVVNTFSRPKNSNDTTGTFLIVPGNKNTNINDLEFMEYSDYVERALIHQGLIKELDAQKASILVFLSYGIGEPEEHNYTYTVPVFGQTGVASKQTVGSVYTFGNTDLYSANTTYTPQYGVTGYRTGQGSTTTYSRYISIIAYNLSKYREQKKEEILWDTRLTSVGSSGDLRMVFPVMIAASLNSIGKNTKGIKDVDLYENDERVLFIKNETNKNINNKLLTSNIIQEPIIRTKKIHINIDGPVAVMDFDAKSISASDACTVSEFIRADMVNVAKYDIVDRKNMELVLAEQKFQMTGCSDSVCAVKIGKILNVKYIMLGTVSKIGDIYYIIARIVDVSTGKILTSLEKDAGNINELRSASTRLVNDISK